MARRRRHSPCAASPHALARCAQVKASEAGLKAKKKQYEERYKAEARRAQFGTRPGEATKQVADVY